jgi:hypothetical protein
MINTANPSPNATTKALRQPNTNNSKVDMEINFLLHETAATTTAA